MDQAPTITIEESPDPQEVERIREGLKEYNDQYAPHVYHSITVILRDKDGKVIGGLLGGSWWEWMYVGILWIDENFRRSGYGGQLLASAEREALRRGCHHVYLDTMSFQALPFYEKQGYSVFGVLNDFPTGHRRYFLQKEIRPGVNNKK